MIENYDFGAMVVDGTKYTADLILLPGRINPSWWRKEGHRLNLEDIEDVLQEDIEVLVIGTGFFGFMKVSSEVHQAVQSKGIVLRVEKTKKATQIFNEFAAHKRTAGAFHLTC
ncbi:MAG: MTH938/NDUFAF3 family protein [Clostridiales bacterium]|nr:MTH938/NDUFAF3 family protein [Clostridiales bacterium]